MAGAFARRSLAEHMMITQVGADNERAKNKLDWLPEFPTWENGLDNRV